LREENYKNYMLLNIGRRRYLYCHANESALRNILYFRRPNNQTVRPMSHRHQIIKSVRESAELRDGSSKQDGRAVRYTATRAMAPHTGITPIVLLRFSEQR